MLNKPEESNNTVKAAEMDELQNKEENDESKTVKEKIEVKEMKEEKEIKEVKNEEADKSKLKEDHKPVEDQKQDTIKEVAAFTTTSLKLVPCNCQHIGARERQEDAFGFSDLADGELVENSGVLAVVADGMGGLARGDRASQVAVSIFLREYAERPKDEPLNKHLLKTLQRSNTAVYDLAFNGDEDVELGTTLVAVVVQGGNMHWVSVGDSRIYLYRNNRLEQLNKDHIYANKLEDDVKNGLMSRKEADRHPERAFLTSYLGAPELIEVDYSEEPVALNTGDSILLCSDGLTNTLSISEIIDVFNDSPANIAEELVKQALFKEKRHQDNITTLVITCKSVEEQTIKGDEK